MNKRQRKKAQKKKSSVNLSVNSEEIIADLTKVCGESFKPMSFFKYEEDEMDYEKLIKNVPTLPYVTGQYINFMFSNGLTCGDEEKDESVLKPFLYKLNAKGITNYQCIREAIRQAKLYGKCGLRWLSDEDGLVVVPYDRYVTVYEDDKTYRGIKRPICYAISADESKKINMEGPIELDKQEFMTKGTLSSKDKSIIIELPENFVNLRNDCTKENGVSIFDADSQRLRLLVMAYERLNHDLRYDGPGRLIFWMNDSLFGGEDVSAGEIVNNMPGAKKTRKEKAKEEVNELAAKFKKSGSEDVLLASSIFKDMDHIPRVTKATEFLEYVEMKEGSIVAQCLGITPELIGLGDVSGNVSMEKIIDNAMTNTIVPERESFATQLSPMLSGKLGMEKIYFDKYELKQSIDRSAEVYKLVLSIAQFAAMEGEMAKKYAPVADHLAEVVLTMI